MEFNYKTEINRYRRYYQAIGGFASKQRAKNYSAVIFSFLAVSLFGWYAIRPTIQTILLLRREIDDDKIVNQKMEDKIAKLIEAQTTYQKIQNQLAVIGDAAPSNPQAIDLAASIQSLVRSSDASLSSLTVSSAPILGSEQSASQASALVSGNTPSTQTKNQNFVSVPLNLIASGTYTQLFGLVNKLLDYRRILTVENLQISKSTDNDIKSASGSNVLRLVLRLNMYYVSQ
jgi:Tfp pilus assembly protein PilO